MTFVSHVTLPQVEGGNVAGDDARISGGGGAGACGSVASCLVLSYTRPVLGERSANDGGVGWRCGPALPPSVSLTD